MTGRTNKRAPRRKLEANFTKAILRWLEHADKRVVVFQNHAMDSLGMGQLVAQAIGLSDPVPGRAPDGHWGLGWRYIPVRVIETPTDLEAMEKEWEAGHGYLNPLAGIPGTGRASESEVPDARG